MRPRYGTLSRLRPGANATAERSPVWELVRERRRFAHPGKLQWYVVERWVWRLPDGTVAEDSPSEIIAGPLPREIAEVIVVARENAARLNAVRALCDEMPRRAHANTSTESSRFRGACEFAADVRALLDGEGDDAHE